MFFESRNRESKNVLLLIKIEKKNNSRGKNIQYNTYIGSGSFQLVHQIGCYELLRGPDPFWLGIYYIVSCSYVIACMCILYRYTYKPAYCGSSLSLQYIDIAVAGKPPYLRLMVRLPWRARYDELFFFSFRSFLKQPYTRLPKCTIRTKNK